MLSSSLIAGQNALAKDQGQEHAQHMQQSKGEQKAKGQQQAQAQQKRGERTVVGKVVDQQEIAIQGTQHQLVKLENQQGETIVVDLGAATEEMQLEQGDRLMAVGKSARINDRPVLYAKYAGELNAVGRTKEQGAQQQQEQSQQGQQQQQ